MLEALNRRLEWERSSGSIPWLHIARGVKRINHYQFVDDTLLMGGASKIMAAGNGSIHTYFWWRKSQIYA